MNNPHIVAIVGDLHVNSTVALCHPYVQLDDGGYRRASKYQMWMWRRWESFWKEINLVREKVNGKLTIMLNGELADDNVHKTTQLISKNPADQAYIALKTLGPMLDIMHDDDELVVLRGTEAHVGPSACMDEMIAADLGAKPSFQTEERTVFSWWRFVGSFNGTVIDIAHHPGTHHKYSHTKGGDAIRLAAETSAQYARRRVPPPHLTIRGHNHKDADSFDNQPTRGIIMPSWQLSTAFGHRIGGGWLKTGGLYVICAKGYKPKVVKRYHDWPVEGPVIMD